MTHTTMAAVLVELGQPLVIEELELPELKPGQVHVRLAWAGICRTQLSEARGRRGPDRFLPHCMGHEGSGIVIAVGPGVSKVVAGDTVVVTWLKGIGADVLSTHYRSKRLGTVNAGPVTAFMTEAVISENRVVPVPAPDDLSMLALLGCAVPTGAGSLERTAAARPGESVAIFGLGGIGLCALIAARQIGCHPIIAIDLAPGKLALAQELGATHVIHGGQDDVLKAIHAIVPSGVDVAIEASGSTRVMELAHVAVRTNGGRAVLAGNPAAGERIALDPFDLIRGRHILGTWGGETAPDRDLQAYAKAVAGGRLQLDRVVSHRIRLDAINEGLALLEGGDALRILIDLR